MTPLGGQHEKPLPVTGEGVFRQVVTAAVALPRYLLLLRVKEYC